MRYLLDTINRFPKKNSRSVFFKSFAVCMLLLGCQLAMVKAQSSRDQGRWIDTKVSVNGRLEEWGELDETNKSTSLKYTVANNATTLFLVIKSTDQSSMTKILAGGITFTINTAGKKNDKEGYQIQFPLIKQGEGRRWRPRPRNADGATGTDSAALAEKGAQLSQVTKEIGLRGFKDIQDSSVSVYNLYGIKAAAAYDANASLGIELAIPLKLLEINPGQLTELAYNVKLNGLTMPQRRESQEGATAATMARGGGGRSQGGMIGISGGFGRGGGMGGGGGFNMQDLFSATDFWAKYRIVNK